ncbi:hypothetical protein [Paraburkholderia atlantica]|uniref:hypothetical protein n=1 Tax=Paraburkholderia atlantica TaxID=2654982 RepID=UPI00160E6D86|nr:hypothetical protein [Paraburkholderia atlantica]MBB5505900.1 hypothetical protein [Paraburkholderia atlantica]
MTGGDERVTVGADATTGGAVRATVGAVAMTGGEGCATVGAVATTGGAVRATVGAVAMTGGEEGATVGVVATTGGDERAAVGAVATTGGEDGARVGVVATMGVDDRATVGPFATTGDAGATAGALATTCGADDATGAPRAFAGCCRATTTARGDFATIDAGCGATGVGATATDGAALCATFCAGACPGLSGCTVPNTVTGVSTLASSSRRTKPIYTAPSVASAAAVSASGCRLRRLPGVNVASSSSS